MPFYVVNTQLLQVYFQTQNFHHMIITWFMHGPQEAAEEFGAELIKDRISDSPMSNCAMDMVGIVTEVEQLLQYVN